ncbi:hypothetical protein COLO4_05454 [Corchorus olitorius]|uniref:Uncharacterized protein n=1 Tax=Corchorus olitorius TaxID=93759 RepID=A0A1R3KQW8_9ROSI|nr:hypothetical protein COLO4_05454 [Corchorus olitorius]
MVKVPPVEPTRTLEESGAEFIGGPTWSPKIINERERKKVTQNEYAAEGNRKKSGEQRIGLGLNWIEEGDDMALDYWPIGAEICKLSRVRDRLGSGIEIG